MGGAVERKVEYRRVKFSPETIQEAWTTLASLIPEDDRRDEQPSGMEVELDSEAWAHDTYDEFKADYRKDCVRGHFDVFPKRSSTDYRLIVTFYGGYSLRTNVTISAPYRPDVLKVFSVFDSAADSARVPEPPNEPDQDDTAWESRVTVFIGHGGDPAWRELSDELEKVHGFHTEVFEFGANAGHTTRSVLERLMGTSSFALLVMTAEDAHRDETKHARENVIHEAGLFQGRLGFDRAIVLLEDGCSEFSNIRGLQQIRFSPGLIKSAVGEVLGTLRREFSPHADR